MPMLVREPEEFSIRLTKWLIEGARHAFSAFVNHEPQQNHNNFNKQILISKLGAPSETFG